MVIKKGVIYKTIVVFILLGAVLISSVSAGTVQQKKIEIVKSSTNNEILLPKEGSDSVKFASGNLISRLLPQGNISPYYNVNPFLIDKPDWQKQNFSLTITLPPKAESISFGLYDQIATACCCGKPFMGQTNFIY
jgi:hypothetical protein